MKYKGYEITKQLLPGSTFNFTEDGKMKPRKPKHPEDVDCYYAEQISTGFKAANCATLTEMKDHIGDLNRIEFGE